MFLTSLTSLVINPTNYENIILTLIGFSLFIFGIFYFFFSLNNNNDKEIQVNFKFLSENQIIVCLFILMSLTYFIPPIKFSEMIISWEEINIFNYIRAIIFLLGCAFVPGSCFYKIAFPNNFLCKKINVEPFLFKITLYPLISFTFLGSLTLLMDFIRVSRAWFSFYLFFSILVCLILNITTQKKRLKSFNLIDVSEISISRYSLFIIFMAFSIIVIVIGIHLDSKYLFVIDSYRAMSYSSYIGLANIEPSQKSYVYAIYWSYISFSLSTLSGLPVININVMLIPFTYLSITSLYLFMRTLLKGSKEKYALLSSVLAISFGSLLDFNSSIPVYDRVSQFVFYLLFSFRYKSFSILLSIMAMTLFLRVMDQSIEHAPTKHKSKTILITVLSSFLLIQSFMIYFLPIIPAFSLFFLMFIFSKGKKRGTMLINVLIALFLAFFIFFDIINDFFFSWMTTSQFIYFTPQELFPFSSSPSIELVFNALLIYLSISSLIAVVYFIQFLSTKKVVKIVKLKLKRRINTRDIFILLAIGVLSFLVLEIILNYFYTKRSLYYFTFILHLFFFNIGIIGILGLFFCYFFFLFNKTLFYIMMVWFIFFFGLSIVLFIINFIYYPNLSPIEVPSQNYLSSIYWFDRIWYYSIFPLSIFSSFIIIKFLKKIHYAINRKITKAFFQSFLKIAIIMFLTFLPLTNTIIAGIRYSQFAVKLNSVEAQVSGWVTQNLPKKSKFLVDTKNLYIYLDDLIRGRTYYINDKIDEGYSSIKHIELVQSYEINCSVEILPILDSLERVLEFYDMSKVGNTSVKIELSEISSYGSISFSFKITNSSKIFSLQLFGNQFETGISMMVKNEYILISNGSNFQPLIPIENNYWYQIQLNFESTTGSYLGLDKFFWNIEINETNYGVFMYWQNISNIERIHLSTDTNNFNYSFYISNFRLSWDTDFKLENSLFQFLFILDFIDNEGIPYLIVSKEETIYKTLASEKVKVFTELIPFLFKHKIYSYRHIEIYSK